jgi:hypothetical protein
VVHVDHPWAVAERLRRRAAYFAQREDTAAKVTAWADRVEDLEPGSTTPDFEAAVRELADMTRSIAEDSQLPGQDDQVEPDELAVHRRRHCG